MTKALKVGDKAPIDVKRTLEIVHRETGIEDVKLLPQNTAKTSIPAKLVNKYAKGNQNAIIWMYNPKKRYLGFLIWREMLINEKAGKWYERRAKNAKKVIAGTKYNMVIFNT